MLKKIFTGVLGLTGFTSVKPTPKPVHVYKKDCKHCHGEGDIMLTNLDGSVTGQAFGECSCWRDQNANR